MRLHHVQVAAPPGAEDDCRRFYAQGLGLTEVAKPADLRRRGGVWFRGYDDAGRVVAELHVGIERDFRPARKAHPGLLVDSVTELEDVANRLSRLGFRVDWAERRSLPAHERFHVLDPHGIRVEVLARTR